MDTHELPEDLAEVERQLASRPRPAPSDPLRRRVMGAVRRELPGAPPQRLGTWEFALAAAAAVLLALNLAMSAANNTDWTGRTPLGSAPDPAAADAIRRLVPGMSHEEARGRALLLQAAGQLVMAPQPRPPAPASYKELLAPGRPPANRDMKSQRVHPG